MGSIAHGKDRKNKPRANDELDTLAASFLGGVTNDSKRLGRFRYLRSGYTNWSMMVYDAEFDLST